MGSQKTRRSVLQALCRPQSPEVTAYPRISVQDYDKFVHPRRVLSQELSWESDAVREEVLVHGWECHGKFAVSMISNSSVQVARTELGWLLWVTGQSLGQGRYVSFPSLGHLVKALAEDPFGSELIDLLDSLLPRYLHSDVWAALKGQLRGRWNAIGRETMNNQEPVTDRWGKSVSWWQGYLSHTSHLPSLGAEDVHVPASLFEHGAVLGPTCVAASPPGGARRHFQVRCVNAEMTKNELYTRCRDRADEDMRQWAWSNTVSPPTLTTRGGLPDGWAHVTVVHESAQEDTHLVRTSYGWALVGDRKESTAMRSLSLRTIILAEFTLGDLVERFAAGVHAGPNTAMGGYQHVLPVLYALCEGRLQGLPAGEAETQSFLAALDGTSIPRSAYDHMCSLVTK